ncbi:MAG: type 1 periplasmic-binding domain-containing protein [Acidimicrobiales bacterium]
MRHRTTRVCVAALLTLALIGAACSKPAAKKVSGGGSNNPSGGSAAPKPGATTTTAAGGAAKGPGASGGVVQAPGSGKGVPVSGDNGLASGIGLGDQNQAIAVGSHIGPQSTQRSQPYYQGVGDNTITVDIGTDQQTCGVNTVPLLVAAGGLLPTPSRFYRAAPTSTQVQAQEKLEAHNLETRYFNEHAFDIAATLPGVRKYMGNDPNNQFYGRHLVMKTIDSGSFQCADKTKAAAVKADQQDKAFAVLIDDALEGSAYNMANDLSAVPANHRPMQFGTLWLSDQIYHQFAPYDWTQFATGTTIVSQWASWICSKLVGQKASNSPDPATAKQTRKFGFVHPNLPQNGVLANEFKGDLKADCGGQNIIVKEITYNGTDVGQQQSDAENIAVQLKTSGVTSVIMLTDFLFPDFLLGQASAQSYHPEWVYSSYGLEDASAIQRIYDSANCDSHGPGEPGAHSSAGHVCETAGAFGISQLGMYGGFNYDKADAFTIYHLYHQVAPDGKPCDPSSDAGMEHGGGVSGSIAMYCKAPSAQATAYYVWLDFIGGLLFAGPDLTPTNITNGLQHYPHTRYGGNGPSSDPRPALVAPGPGSFGFVQDAVEWKWRPDFTSPKPEYKYGWVSYPDCGRHYFSWPSSYSPGWEPNGPNWTKYCNDANGYPTNYSPQP